MSTPNNFNIINEKVGSFTGYQILQVIPSSQKINIRNKKGEK